MRPTAKTLRFILTASLLLMSVQLVSAQDAFYIYRNDGDFDGFFYDQVKRMGCSKIDLDGVEHSDYVVQEVETEDSLYRIPLAAIDSIGFQQPDVIFNPRLKNMDELGISEYVEMFGFTEERTGLILLNSSIPDDLVPEIGDVLVSFDNPKFNEASYYEDAPSEPDENSIQPEWSGFGGKVVDIEDEGGGWRKVVTEPLNDISDIFVRLVCVEQVGYDNQGNVKRRIAGYDYDEQGRKWVRREKTGGGSVNLIDFSQTLHVDKEIGSNGSASLELGVGLKMGMQVAYNISWSRIFFKLSRDMDVEVGLSATLKSSTDFEAEISGLPKALSSIKFPAVAPIFQTKPLPMAFLRGGGELAAKLKAPSFNFGYTEALIFDTDNDYIPFRFSCEKKGTDTEEAEKTELIDTADLELSLSGFLQAGLKFSANVATNDWLEDIFHSLIELAVYVGPKIEGNLSLSASKLAQSGAYEALEESSVKLNALSVDLKAQAMVKMLWKDPKYFNFLDATANYGTVEWKLFPSFKESQVTFNQENERIDVSIFPFKKTFFPNTLCIGLYNYLGERIQKYEHNQFFFLTESIKEVKTTFSTKGLPCGTYTVKPYLKVAGVEVEVPYAWQTVDVTPVLIVHEDVLTANGKGESLSTTFKTNIENIQIEYLDEDMKTKVDAENSWIIATVSDIDTQIQYGKLNLQIKRNAEIWNRKGYVVLKVANGSFVSTDTLEIQQASDFMGFASCSMSFAGEAQGENTVKSSGVYYGDDVNEITHITNLSYGISVSGDNITYTRNDDILTINVSLTEPYDGVVSYSGVGGEGSSTTTFELVLDVSSKPARLLSGRSFSTATYSCDDSEVTYYEDEPSQIFISNSTTINININNSFNWTQTISEESNKPSNTYLYFIYSGKLDMVSGSLNEYYYKKRYYAWFSRDNTINQGNYVNLINESIDNGTPSNTNNQISVSLVAKEEL